MSFVWINGKIVPETEARVGVRDAGLLHGVGVFTTLIARNGRPIRLASHVARLRASCEHFHIPHEPDDAALVNAVHELLQHASLADARIRITVTRGEPDDQGDLRPNLFISAAPFQPYPPPFYERGMTVAVCDTQKLNPFDTQAGHKTLDYLSRFTALREAQSRGANEALWFNVFNFLQSGSISNVFIVKNHTLITPPTNSELDEPTVKSQTKYDRSNVLPGVTRQAVIEAAIESGVAVHRRGIDINEVLDADEIFLTNSVMGVMPVCRVERKQIGQDKPGELTRMIAKRLAESEAQE